MMSAETNMATLEKSLLSDIVTNITGKFSNCLGNIDIRKFIYSFCESLNTKLVFQRHALETFLILNEVKIDQFATTLKELIKEMEDSLAQEYARKTSISDITRRIEQLPSKPHDLLFNLLYGCGHQCPFCKTPCDAGCQRHENHRSNLHRPTAFGKYRWVKTNKLMTDICTSLVASECTFRDSTTNFKFHPYKDYRKFYPDWSIAGDASYEASDYWKYVLKEFNREFAAAYHAEPADIPSRWNKLTKGDALTSLKRAFNRP